MTNPEGEQSATRPPRSEADRTSGVRALEPSHQVRARILREELAVWREQGLISAEQFDVLLAHSSAAPHSRSSGSTPALAAERRLGRGIAILVTLGAILLGAGLIVFLASNWTEFGRPLKIASLFLLTLLFYCAGFELTEEGRLKIPTLGLALVFLGCVMFGVDILLLGLMYDISARHAWPLLIDAAVWLGMAYLLQSQLVLVLGLIGVVSWFGAEVGYLLSGHWLYLGRPFHFLGLGACLLAISGLHAGRQNRRFAAPYAVVGLLLIYLSTLLLSIVDVQRGFRAIDWQAPIAVWLMLAGPYVLTAMALLVIHFRWRQTALRDPSVILALILLVLLVALTIVAGMPGHREAYFTLLLTMLTAGGIYLGIAWESPIFLNTSIAFFAINVYTRFYEYLWNAMPQSLFFIIGGALLIGGGVWVERVRRRVVRRFTGDSA
jgi:uncharacterized membrane protein